MKTIAVVVVNWNQEKLTTDTLKSLEKCTLPKNYKLKIILVDNNSKPEIVATLTKFIQNYKNIQYLQLNSNTGFCYANNTGIKLAMKNKYTFCCLCNNDVIVKPDIFARIIDCFHKNSNISILTPKIYFSPGKEYFYEKYKDSQRGKVIWSVGGKLDKLNIYGSNLGIDEVDTGQYDQENKNLDFATGCFLFAKTALYNKIGLLDENYFMYFEDVDLSIRAKTAKLELIYCPKAVLWHVNSGSSSASSNLHQYFITRNRLYFGMKYASLRTRFALFRESIGLLIKSKEKWVKQGILDYYLGKMGRGSWHV